MHVLAADTVTLSPPFVSLIISAIIPIVVGIISKATLAPAIKAVFLLVFNALNVYITTAIVVDGSAVFTQQTFAHFLVGVVISIAVYFGVYKPANLTDKGALGPDFGLGPKV